MWDVVRLRFDRPVLVPLLMAADWAASRVSSRAARTISQFIYPNTEDNWQPTARDDVTCFQHRGYPGDSLHPDPSVLCTDTIASWT